MLKIEFQTIYLTLLIDLLVSNYRIMNLFYVSNSLVIPKRQPTHRRIPRT